MRKSERDLVVNEVFLDMLADLKSNREVDITFHLFFEDGYWKFTPPRGMPKNYMYGVMNIVISEEKPLAYVMTSDCNMRSPETGEIVGEQLIAIVVTPDGQNNAKGQSYTRLPGGKIKYEERMDMQLVAGDAIVLYEPSGAPAEVKDPLLNGVRAEIKAKKVPYKEYGKANDGPSFH
ncbi:hypothetical protein [Pseudomonas putida]|uniref:Uncharacterized protein n=1 Tax=Pseudomonas putida TaxID=303 RepID=A0A8I1EA78_PSEPU|nr:hypothetical protein [Pseudomonas putida]MBI6882690.1 hypothetical protein [Pseudomonas putida]